MFVPLDIAVASIEGGLGYAIIIPPNREQEANEVIGIVTLKTYTEEHIGNYAFSEGDEKAFADFQRFRKILKRKEVTYSDGKAVEVKWIAL